MAYETCDVLVVGAGIAGCEAALAAAGTGARVTLASAGETFSGSSFFGGTWGLGLVGPACVPDGEKDLEEAILSVGRGVALRPLVRALVAGVGNAVARLEARGVALRRAERAGERDYIPCFDRAHRSWHGLERASYRAATEGALARAGVRLLPRHELQDLLVTGDRGAVGGASLVDVAAGRPRKVYARAVVLATGGFGGLFSRTLTMPDVLGTAAAVALSHGARLVNAEFIQIMPGLVEPVRDVVFNERTFRYARVEGLRAPGAAELLDERGGHGPFTASLPDRAVDFALAAAGPRGAAVSYELPARLPEFMQTYFDWFEGAFGRRPDEGVRVAPYAHASNGGILVDERGATGVEGLFACGEAAGGMHGADRIGGLSSANCLVFGWAAGRAAAQAAADREAAARAEGFAGEKNGRCFVDWGPGDPIASPEAGAILSELRRGMDERCLVTRDEEGLRAQLALVERLDARLAETCAPADDWREDARHRRVELALLSAHALVTAMLARTESRGAHFRADFSGEDPAQARPLAVRLVDGRALAESLEDA